VEGNKMSFRSDYNAKLDIEIARVHEDHPEFTTTKIANEIITTIWAVRMSLKRLGIKLPEGRRPRLNPEN
jgi:hypothetical protein